MKNKEMFNIIKSLLFIFISYKAFVFFNESSFSLEEIIPYMYAFSGVVIFISFSVYLYYTKVISKKTMLMFALVFMSLGLFSLSAYAENSPSRWDSSSGNHSTGGAGSAGAESKQACGLCVTTVTGDDGEFSCWPCFMFEKIFNIFDRIVTGVVSGLTSSLLSLVTIGFVLWLAYTILLQFIAFKNNDIGRFFSEIGVTALKVLLVASLLNLGPGIYTYILNPLVSLISDYAGIILQTGDCSISGSGSGSGSALSGELRTNLFCMVRGLYEEVLEGINTGSVIMCISFERVAESWYSKFMSSGFELMTGMKMPDLILLLFGAVMWFCYVIVLIVFPFMVFDILFRFCFFSIGLPFIIAFWPFSFLKGYLMNIFKILMVAVLNLLMMGILFRIMTTLFASIMTNNKISILLNLCASGKYQEIAQAMRGTDSIEIFFSIFMLVFVTYVSLSLLRTIPKTSALLVQFEGREWMAAAGAFSVAGGAAMDVSKASLAVPGVLVQDTKSVAKWAKKQDDIKRQLDKADEKVKSFKNNIDARKEKFAQNFNEMEAKGVAKGNKMMSEAKSKMDRGEINKMAGTSTMALGAMTKYGTKSAAVSAKLSKNAAKALFQVVILATTLAKDTAGKVVEGAANTEILKK